MKQPAWKRALDLGLAVPALIALSPVLGAVAAAVRASMGSPVIFSQERPGLDERPFRLFKFRTMHDAVDADGRPLPDVQRVSRVGSFLRASSLDELPELVNVVRGEMSLVGPRPLLMRYLPYFKPEERLRFTALPGITGLAQIEGRNDLPWDARLALDVDYVRRMSPWFDLVLLTRTVLQVARRSGVQVVPGCAMQDLDAERRNAPWVRREPACRTDRDGVG
jgi:lipopolysaccharide/colanic/teichoic acid biosynthesis glycosyltransferase